MQKYNNINQKDPIGRILGFCLAGSLSFVLLSGIVLASLRTSATTTSHEDPVSITVPSSCTMGGNIASGEEHTATLSPGTYSGDDSDYANGIGRTTLTTFCNDYDGFSIYAIGYTGNNYGNNTLVGSNTSTTINTGVYTQGDTTSKWSMKVNKVEDSTETYNPNNMTIENSFNNYHNVPTNYTKVAQYKAQTGSSITDRDLGAKVTTTYAAYISSSQTADTYQGQVKYTMVHPYNADEPPLTIATADYLQDVETCPASLPTGQVYTLRDSRDNQEYRVAKLADGKCWMVENLNIAGGTALSANDTDVTSDYIANGSFPAENRLIKSGNTLVLPASSTTGFDTDNYSYVYNSGNKANCGAYGQDVSCYSYYSWDATTLGSGRDLDTENVDAPYSICPKNWRLPTSGADANNGWKRSDFYALATAYDVNLENTPNDGSTTFYDNVGPNVTPNFSLAGYYASGSLYNSGSRGYYLSATSSNDITEIRHLYFNTGYINSATRTNSRYGFSARCLFSGQ